MTEDKKDDMDPTLNKTDGDDPSSPGDEPSSSISLDNGPLNPEVESPQDQAPELLHMDLEPEKSQNKSGTAKQEPARDGFKPFYKKEARMAGLMNLVLYFLLVVFGLGLLGFGIQVFLDAAPFRLEVATTVVIVFALVGFLWKTVSLEAKTGLAAAGVGLVLAEVFTVYGGSMGLPWVSGTLVLAVVYCLSLAALLVATWLYWPRLFWPPLVITVLVLYAALDPALWLAAGATGSAETLVSGPALMQHWPIYLRPGFLMSQVILPAGAILLLVLQVRTIMKPQYQSHWGFVFWALLLLLTSTTGLAVLERADYPAYPNFPALVARAYPRALPPAPVPAATEEKTETTTPPAVIPDVTPDTTPDQTVDQAQTQTQSPTPDETAAGTAPAPDQTVTEPQTATTPGPDAAASTDEKAAEAAGSPSGVPEEKLPATAETAPSDEAGTAPESTPPAASPSEDLKALQSEMDDLKRQVRDLQRRVQDQENLIRSLLDYFGPDSKQDSQPWPVLPKTMPLPEPDTPDQPDSATPSHSTVQTIIDYCPA